MVPLEPVPGETGHSVRPRPFNLLCKIIVVCDNHAPLTGGHIFVPKKAETTDVSNGAEFFGR